MPISKYYGGHGESVMEDMKARYGSDKGERVFYATANKQKSLDEHIGHTIKSIRRKHKISRRLEKK
jgi:hypothetical protein